MLGNLCPECKKSTAVGIEIFYVGGKDPALLHDDCYQRLKEIESMYKDLCK